MPKSLFFQSSPLVRVVGQDRKGFTTHVLISLASPWVGELMSSISPHGEQCIILPDVAWKDISGLLIQSESSKAMSDYLLDLLTTTPDNVEESQKTKIGNLIESVKREICQESTFNECVKHEDIGKTTVNANENLNLNKRVRTIHKIMSEDKDSSIIDRIGNSSKRSICNICDKSYSSVFYLKQHRKTVHKVIYAKKDPSRRTILRRAKKTRHNYKI